ncbi:RNA polymerase sigma factor SigF [Tumidithrix elongata RA019]|uniref:RNA polymerase sigma factor SigF n=1 Tax=Tumidithrix elongata BACA0141 TaxID=2716417 RepID=A0AAW9PQT9_9CYAN|nr:RNA polymerase sigma factor SigF [Tumidithrix elongata RA019]
MTQTITVEPKNLAVVADNQRNAESKIREFSAEDKSTTLELLKAYRLSPSAKVRNQLVKLNIGLVKKEVSYWINQASEAYEDLLQVGSIGLMGAIERFEVNRGYAFSSFAVRYIRGEIQHYLRDKSSTLRVPRRCLELHQQAIKVAQQLRSELKREPSPQELANALGVSLVEWQEVKLAYQNRCPLSLDAPVRSDEDCSACLAEMVPDPRLQGLQDDHIRLQQALTHLESRTREIVEFVFLEDLTQREVAKMLGVSAVTISRQVKKGLTILKCVMAAEAC